MQWLENTEALTARKFTLHVLCKLQLPQILEFLDGTDHELNEYLMDITQWDDPEDINKFVRNYTMAGTS